MRFGTRRRDLSNLNATTRYYTGFESWFHHADNTSPHPGWHWSFDASPTDLHGPYASEDDAMDDARNREAVAS